MADSSVFGHLRTVEHTSVGRYGVNDGQAWQTVVCSYCGGGQMAVLATQIDTADRAPTRWLRCVNCLKGAVSEGGITHPPSKPLRAPQGLPQVDAAIWEEVRVCLGVGANVAAVMLCRKLLFHIAVSHGLPAKDNRDRAPSYMEAVKHLEAEGLITKRMLPWVERIKDVGNDANHELTPIPAEVALDVATFTEQLLILAYELDALMVNPSMAVEDDASVPPRV